MENKKIVFEEIKLKDIKEHYKVLDDWNDYYGWSVYKNNQLYILEDTQTGDIEYFDNLLRLLERISSRALDYETDERIYDDECINIDNFNYLNNLVFIYLESQKYSNELCNRWLKSKIEFIQSLEA